MSTGGLFQLITNDGKQDRMLMATALLNDRLLDIEKRRTQAGFSDPTPTLVDIERTHILFMNAHFKPFAAIGYEYNKVSTTAGQARLGSSVQFSIPQFGDFFNDMALHVQLGAVEAVNSAYWSSPASSPATGSELLKYCDYLGQRLAKKTNFTVNGNPLDEYTSDVLNFHREFMVTPNKIVGWNRNVGQEVSKPGFCDVSRANGRSGRGAGVRESRAVLDGPQTPKPAHGAIDVWVPLLFWFNKDPRLSIPSVSIPYGQRYINVDLASANEILQHVHASNPALDSPGTNPVPVPDVLSCELYINNIFVNPEIHDIFIKRIGFSLIRVHRLQTQRCNKSSDQVLLQQLKWPIETIYAGMRPSDNVDVNNSGMCENWCTYAQVVDSTVSSAGLADYPVLAAAPLVASPNPVTVAQLDAVLVDVSAGGVQLQTVGTITGVAGGTSLTVGLLNAWLSNYGFALAAGVASATFAGGDALAAAFPMAPAKIHDETGAAFIVAGAGAQDVQLRYKTQVPCLDTIQIEAHGVALYKYTATQFFNSYLPYVYGGQHINTPLSVGSYMIPFNLYPGSYQPSGHVNLSRAREFYFQYTSSNVGSSVASADLVIVAVAINFLLISDGSCILRYST